MLVALQHGVAEFRAAGHEVRWIGVTDKDGTLDFVKFYEYWPSALRYSGELHAYAAALEPQPQSGRLHGHALLIGPKDRSGWVTEERFDKVVRQFGFGNSKIGWVHDVPPVSDKLAGYFTKGAAGEYSIRTRRVGTMGSYMAKATEMDVLAGMACSRLRPFRVSMNWPLKLTEAQNRLRAEFFGSNEPDDWFVTNESRLGAWLPAARAHVAEDRARDARWTKAAGQVALLDGAA